MIMLAMLFMSLLYLLSKDWKGMRFGEAENMKYSIR